LAWHLKHGQVKHDSKSGMTNEGWFDALRAEGFDGGLPIDERPELFEDLYDVWFAFFELTGSRPVGFGGAGPIPYNVVSDYMNENEIYAVDFRDWFRRMIAALDRALLEEKNNGAKCRDWDSTKPRRFPARGAKRQT